MKTTFFSLLLCCCFAYLSAQQNDAPRFGVELTTGMNFTEKLRENDEAGIGIYLDVSAYKYLQIANRLHLAGGLGLYMHQFQYRDFNTFSFGCDLPISLGGDGQQTFVETSAVHAGISVPARLYLTLGQTNRWIVAAGADLKIPILGQHQFAIFECGGPSSLGSRISNSTAPFRSILPEFTFGFGYGFQPKKGDIFYVGPFLNFTSDTHIPSPSTLASVSTITVGLRATGPIM